MFALSSTSEVFSSTSSGGEEAIIPGTCWFLSRAFDVFQLGSSTLGLTLLWCSETRGGDSEWDRDRDRDWEARLPVPSSTSSLVDSSIRLLRFAGVRVSRGSVAPTSPACCEIAHFPSAKIPIRSKNDRQDIVVGY